MLRYKTYLNLKCKTFKFELGLNILIPILYENSEALVNEMILHFKNSKSIKNHKDLFMYITSPSAVLNDWDSPEKLSTHNNIICLIDGRHTNFMFMSAAEKLNFRMRLNELSKKYNNLYLIFITDDYGYLSHNRCISIDNSRTARTFKSYSAYAKFLTRGDDDNQIKFSCDPEI